MSNHSEYIAPADIRWQGSQPFSTQYDDIYFSADGNAVKSKRLRDVKIKYGRAYMLVMSGYIVPEYFKRPGYTIP